MTNTTMVTIIEYYSLFMMILQQSMYIKHTINSSLYWNLDWMELFWDPITGHLSCSGILWRGKFKKTILRQ